MSSGHTVPDSVMEIKMTNKYSLWLHLLSGPHSKGLLIILIYKNKVSLTSNMEHSALDTELPLLVAGAW